MNMYNRFEEKLTSIPEIPKAFGEDGGHFYRYYDAIADEIDDDMVKSLKGQLDGILIYAGLFAGVNSAFLALTLPEMSPDPADDTNALLLQLVTGGNGNITSVDDLPSASFSPASGIFPVNILFSLSLTLALLAAFLAVLGQQWLVYYRKRSGGGPEAQRWEQLRRYLGAKRWRLEVMLDDILPSLLQLGLIIFCIALALYLGTLSRWICYTVAVPMGIALACILFMAVSAALDKWCPFKSPLSRAFQSIPPSVARSTWLITLYCLSWAFNKSVKAKRIIGRATGPMAKWAGQAASHLQVRLLRILSRGKEFVYNATGFIVHRTSGNTFEPSPWSWRGFWLEIEYRIMSQGYWSFQLLRNIPRPAEPVDRLNAIAAKRVLCTSEDANALIYAAVNLHALSSPGDCHWLLCDGELCNRLTGGWGYSKQSSSFDHVPSDPPPLIVGAFRSAFTSLVFSSGSAGFLLGHDLGLPPFSTPSDDTDSECTKVIEDSKCMISVMKWLEPSLRQPSIAVRPSPQTLCQNLITIILDVDYWRIWDPRQWFEDNAALYDASAREIRTFAPISVCLLVYAIQCFTKISPYLSSLDFNSEPERLTLLDTLQPYTKWGLHAVHDIIRIYSAWRQHQDGLMYKFNYAVNDRRGVLGLIEEGFSTFQLDPSVRPSDSIYVSLLRQGWTVFNDYNVWSDEHTDARSFFPTCAMDLSNHLIRLSWQPSLSEAETAQKRKDLTHCVEVLRDTFLSWRQPLSYVSASQRRRIDIFNEAVISKIIDLEHGLNTMASRREEQNQPEEYQRIFQGIKEMSFARLSLSNIMGNPADPPTVQAVEKTSD
ncbi:hypothetical protein FRC01_005283 [Tulasnella sp. 417]|nr:hypothetical protein FRC01_005283 [Tulasnella sp. 417]